MRAVIFTLVAICVVSLTAASPANAGGGIDRLANITAMKAEQANQTAMTGANAQRDLLRQQEELRQRQSHLEEMTHSTLPPAQNVTPQTQAQTPVCRHCVLREPSTSNTGH